MLGHSQPEKPCNFLRVAESQRWEKGGKYLQGGFTAKNLPMIVIYKMLSGGCVTLCFCFHAFPFWEFAAK